MIAAITENPTSFKVLPRTSFTLLALAMIYFVVTQD